MGGPGSSVGRDRIHLVEARGRWRVADRVLQLKITLAGSKPPIWRRVRVSESMCLRDLHTTIQITMGWHDEHLHEFEFNGASLGDLEEDEVGGAQGDRGTTLRDLQLARPKTKFRYIYDFGDGWIHDVVVEAVEPADPNEDYPVCIGGKLACPPEDCGGIGGYYNLLEAVSDPSHPDHADLSEWLGPDFDPTAFDLEAVNNALRREC